MGLKLSGQFFYVEKNFITKTLKVFILITNLEITKALSISIVAYFGLNYIVCVNNNSKPNADIIFDIRIYANLCIF